MNIVLPSIVGISAGFYFDKQYEDLKGDIIYLGNNLEYTQNSLNFDCSIISRSNYLIFKKNTGESILFCDYKNPLSIFEPNFSKDEYFEGVDKTIYFDSLGNQTLLEEKSNLVSPFDSKTSLEEKINSFEVNSKTYQIIRKKIYNAIYDNLIKYSI